MVSRKKKRFERDGFNLDLAYITNVPLPPPLPPPLLPSPPSPLPQPSPVPLPLSLPPQVLTQPASSSQRIIAMGFPSTGVEGVYRNPLAEVGLELLYRCLGS